MVILGQSSGKTCKWCEAGECWGCKLSGKSGAKGGGKAKGAGKGKGGGAMGPGGMVGPSGMGMGGMAQAMKAMKGGGMGGGETFSSGYEEGMMQAMKALGQQQAQQDLQQQQAQMMAMMGGGGGGMMMGGGMDNGCKWCAQGSCWGCKASGGAKGMGKGMMGMGGMGGMMGGMGDMGGGQWVMVPPGGGGGAWSVGGWGGAKSPGTASFLKNMKKFSTHDANQKVHVQGLTKKTNAKAFLKYITDTTGVTPVVAEIIMHKGTGVSAFKTPEDAIVCIAALNGATLDGKTLVASEWQEKPEKEGRGKRSAETKEAKGAKKQKVA